MTGRQIFSHSEKLCLQELIIKYKLNSALTIAAGTATKKMLWESLVEEFNSIENNSKRTVSQLKKCWDNLKTRKKALEKRKCMQKGGESYLPTPKLDTLMEIKYVIDSDNLPQEISTDEGMQDTVVTEETEPGTSKDKIGRSLSRDTDYSTSDQHKPGAKNNRAKIISDEFEIIKHNYQRMQEREEELHKIMLAEKQWLLKAAEEIYKKAKIERIYAEEIIQIKREEAKRQVNKK